MAAAERPARSCPVREGARVGCRWDGRVCRVVVKACAFAFGIPSSTVVAAVAAAVAVAAAIVVYLEGLKRQGSR
eukprot:11175833-Lingulodinium_polyedra.AAC.1